MHVSSWDTYHRLLLSLMVRKLPHSTCFHCIPALPLVKGLELPFRIVQSRLYQAFQTLTIA